MTLTTATHTLVLKRQSGRYKFKLLAGKFTWGNKAKYYWFILTNSLFSKICWQCPAMFAFTPQTNFPAHYLKKISLKVKVIGSNPGYLLRSFLLTKIKHFFIFISAQTPSFPSNNSVQYNRRRSATSHSTPNSPTKTRSRSEAFCTCMTTDPSLLGKKWGFFYIFWLLFGKFNKIQEPICSI